MKNNRIIVTTMLITSLFLTSFSCSMIEVQGSNLVVQDTANEIIELALSIGLPEDDPIIVRAQRIASEAEERFCKDRDIIATVVFNEAGYGCSDRHMELVAAVVCNRVNSDKFPDTVYEVVTAPNQYHPAYAKANSYYGKRARKSDVWNKCQDIATKALKGEVDCPDNVFYQANFIQGTDVYEVHSTNYSETWFCYG